MEINKFKEILKQKYLNRSVKDIKGTKVSKSQINKEDSNIFDRIKFLRKNRKELSTEQKEKLWQKVKEKSMKNKINKSKYNKM